METDFLNDENGDAGEDHDGDVSHIKITHLTFHCILDKKLLFELYINPRIVFLCFWFNIGFALSYCHSISLKQAAILMFSR